MAAGRDSQILERLAELEAEKGTLPGSLDFYRRLLCIQSEARSRISMPELHLDSEAVSQRIAGGSPLLAFDDLLIDWPLLRNALEEVASLFASYPEVCSGASSKLVDSITCPGLLEEATKACFEKGRLPPGIAADGADEVLFGFMLNAALKPFLVRHAEVLLGRVHQEQWRRGYCPVCGGDADFASLDKEAGARWLLCSRCDAQWLFQRLECPYCGNQDQSTLAYFTDDSGLYRLYVCEQCHRYLKATDLRRSGGEVLLPLERFLTLDLDIQAQSSGYSAVGKTRLTWRDEKPIGQT